MTNKETLWGRERGHHLYKTSDSAVHMIAERIILENLGLQPKQLPLCSEEESVYIEELIPRAREGFALSLKSGGKTLEQERDLLNITTPETIAGIWSRIGLTDRQNTLPEYWHVLATLKVMARSGRVSFFQFPDPPANMDYETGMTETYWTSCADTFERVWTNMDELENFVRSALYSTRPMKQMDMLKIGHFFMTGKTISSIFNKI